MAKTAVVDTEAAFLYLVKQLRATEESKAGPHPSYVFEREGRCYGIAWRALTKNDPARLTLTTTAGPVAAPRALGPAGPRASASPYRDGWPEAKSPGSLLVRAETGLDRLGKRVGLNREVQLDDAAFDDRVYLESDGPAEDVKAVLAGAATRRALLTALDLGATHVRLEETTLELELTLLSLETVAKANITALADALGRGAESMPVLRPSGDRSRRTKIRAAVMLTAFFAMPASCAGSYASQAAWEPVSGVLRTRALLASPVVWLVCAVGLVLTFRGTSTALRDTLAAWLFAGVAAPMIAIATAVTLNGGLDGSVPTPVPGIVVRRWASRGEDHHVELAPIEEHRPRYELAVTGPEYDTMKPGVDAVLVTKRGTLGQEWRVSLARAR